jgi:hypothetical protein
VAVLASLLRGGSIGRLQRPYLRGCYRTVLTRAIKPGLRLWYSLTLVELVEQAKERIGVQPRIVAADAGYDSNQNIEGMIALGATPVIKRVNRRVKTGKYQQASPRLKIDQSATVWRSEYSSRVAVERLFSRLKGHRALTRHTRRRIEPVSLHCTLAILMMQACALAKVVAGKDAELRACVRSVA